MGVNRILRWQLGLASLFLAATAPLAAPALEPLRAICLPALPLSLVAAEKHGTFADYEIELRAEVAPGSEALRSGLAGGSFEVAHALVDNSIALADSGAADVLIVMGGEHALTELIAQPGIHSVDELRGRTLLVDALNTGYALQLKKILRANGLEPGRDCELKPIGSTPQRLAAMREHKEYAATLLGPPTSALARREGFVSLGEAKKWVGTYQGSGVFVRRDWARNYSGLLVRYLAALIQEQRWLLAPAHKEQVIELLSSDAHLAPGVAAETYRMMIESGEGYEEDAQLDPEGILTVLRLRAEIEGKRGGTATDPARYYDPFLYQLALAKVGAQKTAP